ncbi:MAG: tRNA-2-methylthio-N(6)-dimethylallyladenosine synthase [Chlamydiia bacterium]|nr:tRNA-2-methylthio-N(6)-dimethylallyladenosine synthase [Chlamydiia bacterium]
MKRSNPKTFYIRTYGCQMNELDTEIMVGLLEKKGLVKTDDEKLADIIIFNTCSIRDLAERKVLGKLGQLGRIKKNRPIIGVTGCMAMAKKEALFKKLPHLDFVVGTNNITDLSDAIDQVIEKEQTVLRTDNKFEENLDYLVASRDDKVKASISIIRGCDKYCTYCVVPYTRGREVSRPLENIVQEVKMLADQGYKEVTLLGQNVNSYGKDFKDKQFLFHDLLYHLDAIEGIERIRFLTSHPIDITLDLMQAIRDLPSLCEFVHFPIQAGSSRVLKKMHRIYTKEAYFEKVHLLRQTVPNVALGTDIIVGFPTETEEEFCETLDVFKQLRYECAFLFAYSERKGTPSSRWKDDIPEEVKADRLHRLMDLHNQIVGEIMTDFIGNTVEVLVDAVNEKGQLKGRSRCWKKVVFDAPSDNPHQFIGTLQQVKVTGFNHQTLKGEVLARELVGC